LAAAVLMTSSSDIYHDISPSERAAREFYRAITGR
jgi:hypothetical protein